MLWLKEIRHCPIVARGSLKTLAYITAFLNIEYNKYKNRDTKCVTASSDLPYRLAEKYACKSLYWISHDPRGTTESAIFLKSGFFMMSPPLTFADYVYRTPLIMMRVQCFVMFCNGVQRFLVTSNEAQTFMICGKVYATSLSSNYT